MRILLINHYAGSIKHGMEFRPYYLAREWVLAGHQVQIVAASYSHIRALQPDLMEKGEQKERIDGIHYLWYKTPRYSGNGARRVKNMLSFLMRLWRDAKALARTFRPDVVIASSTYPMDIWPAQRIARLARARLVYEVHDLWPLSPMELGGMSRWHPFIMWVQWAEDYAYKHSDFVVSMLPKTLGYMISRGLAPGKWAYVPNGVDLTEWQTSTALPLDVEKVIGQIKACDMPVVCYAGTHGLANALDVLLDAAALLKGKVQVLLVGTGPERVRLLKRVETEGLDNVTMLNPVSKMVIPQLLTKIDIAYIGWHANPLYRFGISPNKLMDYMMAGKPIIHSVHAGNDPVSEAECGFTVPPGDAVAVAKAIAVLASMSSPERSAIGSRGQRFVMDGRLYPTLARNFLEVIKGNTATNH